MKEIRGAPFDVKIIDLWSIVGESEGRSDFSARLRARTKPQKVRKWKRDFSRLIIVASRARKNYPIWSEVAEDEI